MVSTTRQITIILDNQGVVQDMSSNATSSRALNHKIETIRLIKDIELLAPRVKITLRWCPGHVGVQGNVEADKLANPAAKRPLPPNHTNKPTLASFRAAVKAWAAKASILAYTEQDQKRLGHKPHPKEHMKALEGLKNKHSISSITQLRTGHIPLFHYLASRNLRPDSTCACGTSPETVEHFLFYCPIHEDLRQDLREDLDQLAIPFDRTALHHPEALEILANFTSTTWRLKSRWEWADTMSEATPKHKTPPD